MTRSRAVRCWAVAAFVVSTALSGCVSESAPATSTGTVAEPWDEFSSVQSTPNIPNATAPAYTIADYIRDQGLTETTIRRGDPSAPTMDLPIPPGWKDAGAIATPHIAWAAFVYATPTVGEDPPKIVVIMSRLTGDVSADRIFEAAPSELKNLPGFGNENPGRAGTFSGFRAFEVGGTYQKYGAKRVIAQKTVVIPESDGVVVVQLNAEALEGQSGQLLDAMAAIEARTTISS